MTLKEVAEKAGCSVAAVSTVLNNASGTTAVSAQLRRSIVDLARELDYRPNLSARSIRKQRTHQVAVVIRNRPGDRYAHPLAFEFILGINEALDSAHYIMSLIRVTDLAEGESPVSRAFEGHLFEGVIVVNPLPAEFEARVEKLVPNVVWVDSNEWKAERCIRRDEMAAGRVAVEQIRKLGFDEIVYVGRSASFPGTHYSVQQRRSGVFKAARASGIRLTEVDLPAHSLRDHSPFDAASPQADLLDSEIVDSTFDNIRQLLHPRCAVLFYSMFDARALLYWCAKTGLRPGTDFSVACCDDDRHGTTTEWPGLARVTFDRYRMGYEAGQMMIDLTRNAEQTCQSRLVAGEWFPGDTLLPV